MKLLCATFYALVEATQYEPHKNLLRRLLRRKQDPQLPTFSCGTAQRSGRFLGALARIVPVLVALHLELYVHICVGWQENCVGPFNAAKE